MRIVYFAVLLFLGILAVPGAAGAQSSSDPESGSPPGAVYEIPVESGRDDAAPRGGSGDSRGPRSGNGGSGGGNRAGGGSGGSGSGGSRGSRASSAGSGSGDFASPSSAGEGGGGSDFSGGVSGSGGGGSGGDSSSGGDGGGDGERSSDGSPLRSENGFGSSSDVPGLDERGSLPAPEAANATSGLGTGGTIVAIALLAAVVLAGIALGVARQVRRSRPGTDL